MKRYFKVDEEFMASMLEISSELGFIIQEGLNLESMEIIEEAEKRRYREECRVRGLEASLARISPAEFDQTMAQIEAAQMEVYAAGQAVLG